MAFGDGVGAEAEAVEGAGTVAAHDDVGLGKELVENGLAVGHVQVEQRAPLAQQRVGHRVRRHVGVAGWVDPQDLGAQPARKRVHTGPAMTR